MSRQAGCPFTHHKEALGKGAKHSRVYGNTVLLHSSRVDVLRFTGHSSPCGTCFTPGCRPTAGPQWVCSFKANAMQPKGTWLYFCAL